MNDVPFLDDVLLTLQAPLAGILGTLLATQAMKSS
jgi:hypothetical protein